MHNLLVPTPIFNWDHPAVAQFIGQSVASASTAPRDLIRDLYYAVRDGINYEVFDTDVSEWGISAAGTVNSQRGFCLHKSILYVSACRATGIPARLKASLVENHLSTSALEILVGGTTFLHWYAEVLIDNRWVKMTPVFSKLMCRLYGIQPLDFDLREDSIYQQSDKGTMRFLADYHIRADATHEQLITLIRKHHPLMVMNGAKVPSERAIRTHSALEGQFS